MEEKKTHVAVLLNVQPDGSPGAAGSAQSNHKSRAVISLDIDALVRANAAVQISVAEIISLDNDAAVANLSSDELLSASGDKFSESLDDLGGALGINILVIVAGEEGAAVFLPEFILDGRNGGFLAGVLRDARNDVEPCNNGPETVLLADMVGASAEGLFTADGELVVVEEGAEEFPA